MRALVKSVVSKMGAPKYFIGSSREIKQGLQEKRIHKMQEALISKESQNEEVNKILSELKEFGVTKIPNFLSADEVESLNAKISNRIDSGNFNDDSNREGYGVDWRHFTFCGTDKFISEKFSENSFFPRVETSMPR